MNKTRKKGFTLAEVLIALGIVGIISALTIPTFTIKVQDRQLATSLSKNVEAVENGCQRLIEYTNNLATDGEFAGHYNIHKNIDGKDIGAVAENTISGKNLWTGTSSFFDTKALENAEVTAYTSSVKAFGGGTASPKLSQMDLSLAVNTKTGAYWGATNPDTYETINDPVVDYIYIDVNGKQSPNRYGKDIFLFGLTDACHMVPSGSDRMYAIKIHSKRIPKESANSGCVKGSVSNGLSCTSKVVRDGYKINY